MTSAPLIVVLSIAAVWPFGRGKDDQPTIEDLDAAEVVVDTQAPIEDSAEKAIESYRRFLEAAAGDPVLEAEAMRRLADLELESAEGEDENARAEAAVRDTIAMYERVLESYPAYAKNDLVLYQLARAYDVAGRVEDSLAALERLITQYPQTEHFDEAQFRRGETLFVEQRYDEAERAYTDVLARGEASAFHEQALYKLGWARFKQQDYEPSLEPFFALLDRKLGNTAPRAAAATDADPAVLYGAMTRAEREIVDDALRVLSIAFSYVDGPEAISDYFAVHGTKPYAFIVYLNLGDLYLEQERYHDAADAYAAFVALDAYHAKAPLLQGEAIEAYAAGGFADLVLDEKRRFVETYGPESPYWQRFSYAEQPEAVALLKTNVTDLAAHHHAAAQSTGEAGEYAAAARWYRAYLQAFPDDEKAPETNFLLAEVLYESGELRDAAFEYERTAYGYAPHAHGGEAGYAALLAYAAQEERLTGAEQAQWHRAGIESALRFTAAYPDHEHAGAVATDAAERLYALGELALARDTAQALLERHAAGGDGSLAADLVRTARTVVAHAEFDLANFAAAESAYLALAASIPPGDPSRADIDERVASAIYKQGEEAQSVGLMEAAVEHFLRVARMAPNASIRPAADYDAAAALIQIGDWPRANAVLEEFRTRFPDHALAEDATATLAVGYVEVGATGLAAAEFERIADGDGSVDVKREALWRAAELYSGAGQDAAAARAYERFVERHPMPAAEAIEARQQLVEIAARAGNESERRRWLQALVAADAAAGAERTDRTRYLAAHAQLELAAPARDAFRATRLVMPLDQSLRSKQMRLQEALDAYGRAADYGIADVTTAATFEIADLYHALSKDLFASERPPDLSAEELEQYDLLLEEQAFPFEEEAIELHEVNAARTADGVYDEWVKRSLAALAELVPVRYAKTELPEPPAATLVAANAAEPAPANDEGSKRKRRKRERAKAGETPAVPAQAASAFARAVGAIEAGDWLAAELSLEEVLAVVPASPQAHFNAALVALADERPDAARASLERSVELDPAFVAAYNQLGIVLRGAGEFAASEAAYARALELEPRHARTHYNLGVLLDVYARRPADALEHYETYQSVQDEPDERVGRWIVELRRRLGMSNTARVAKEGS